MPSPAPASPVTSTPGTVFVNGQPYAPNPTWTNPAPTSSAHIIEISSPLELLDYPYHAFFSSLAISNQPFPLPSSFSHPSSVFSISPSIISSPLNPSLPFIIDIGATCHISPFLSDFFSILSIKPHPIKGLGSQTINAVGMGTIQLQTPSRVLSLHNMFYIPDFSAHLISIFLLSKANYNAHFYPC